MEAGEKKAGEKRGSHRLQLTLRACLRHRHLGKSPKLYGCFPRNNKSARIRKTLTKPRIRETWAIFGSCQCRTAFHASVFADVLDIVWDESGKLVSGALRGYDDAASPTLQPGPHSEFHNTSDHQLFRLWELSEASICWATARLTEKVKRRAIDKIDCPCGRTRLWLTIFLRGKRSRTQGCPPAR